MASTDPLLSNSTLLEVGHKTSDVSHKSSGHLSVASIGKLKKKASDWHMRAHEKALDHGMAVGFRDMTAARKVAKWKADSGHHGDEVHHTESQDTSGLQSNFEAITNLLNNCLGSGVLAVPLVIKEVGIATGIVMLFISAVLNRYGLMLVMKCCDIAGIDVSYNTVARAAYGSAGRYAIVFIFIAMGFGCLVSYVDATADAIGALIKTFFGVTVPTLKLQLGSLIVLYPATYIRSLKNVAPISLASFLGALVVVACVVARCGGDLARTGLPPMEKIRMYPDDIGTLLRYIPTCLTVFSIQAGGSITMAALKDGSEANKQQVSLIAYIIILTVNMSLSIPAYLRFLDDTSGNIINAFDPNDPVALVAKIFVLDLVVPSYMFMMIPCRVALIELLFGKNEAKMQATYGQFLGVTTAVNVAAACVALVVSDLSLVIGLVGAVAANSVAFILPSLIYMKVRSQPKAEGMTPVKMSSPRNVPLYVLISFSFFSMFSGIYFLLS